MSQKKPKTKNLRNVLASPFSTRWSENNPEGVASLLKVLEELLPFAKLEKKSLNLNSRGNIKEKVHPGTPLVEKHSNIYRTYISPGFQSVIRGLEKNELCCVLLSSDVSPPTLQKIVCSYCNTYNIPLIIFSELKIITKSTLGFPTMVLGFKKIAESPENQFFPIYEIVSQNRCTFETPFVAKQKEDTASRKEEKSTSRNEASYVSPFKTKDFYLYRERKNERAFRPGIDVFSAQTTQLPIKDRMDEDFISFSKNESMPSGFENLSRNIPKITSKSDSDSDDSSDSQDEDDIFFVDNKPDHILLEIESTKNEKKDPLVGTEFGTLGDKSLLSKKPKNPTNKKVKAINERYFSSKLKQDVKPTQIKNKDKRIPKQKMKDFPKTDRKDKTEKFYPLTIKTVISNPKKIRRKKK